MEEEIKKISKKIVIKPGFIETGWNMLMNDLGIPLHFSGPSDRFSATEYEWSFDEQHSLCLYVCEAYPLEFCMIKGPEAVAKMEDFCKKIDFWSINEICRFFDEEESIITLPVIIYALGLASDAVPDHEIADRIIKSLRDNVFNIRLAGMDAAELTHWPVFKNEILKITETDPEPSLRIIAAEILNSF